MANYEYPLDDSRYTRPILELIANLEKYELVQPISPDSDEVETTNAVRIVTPEELHDVLLCFHAITLGRLSLPPIITDEIKSSVDAIVFHEMSHGTAAELLGAKPSYEFRPFRIGDRGGITAFTVYAEELSPLEHAAIALHPQDPSEHDIRVALKITGKTNLDEVTKLIRWQRFMNPENKLPEPYQGRQRISPDYHCIN